MNNSNNYRNNRSRFNNLHESIEKGDLVHLLSHELHIDEFESKMGEDADVIVLSLLVLYKEPAQDVCTFVEKGYSYVLDADISSGEIVDEKYLVFIEIPRRTIAVDQILDIIQDLSGLAHINLKDWEFIYYKKSSTKKFKLNSENLEMLLPLSPKSYRDMEKKDEDMMEHLRDIVGLKHKLNETTDPALINLKHLARIS